MSTTQSHPAITAHPWQKPDDRALHGAATAAATMAVAAKQMGILVSPAIQRICGPVANPSLRWEGGYQLQPSVHAPEPDVEKVVRAAGRLGRANGEAKLDGLSASYEWHQVDADGDWDLDASRRMHEVFAMVAENAYLIDLCSQDLIAQALRLGENECPLIILSPDGMAVLASA